VFERFDESGKRVLVAATEQARRMGHRYLGTEHLLLGVASLHDDPSGRALASLGVGLDRIRDEILAIVPPEEPSRAADGHLPFTPRVRTVLELADTERTRLGAASVTSSHLLLALVREGEGVAPQVLARLGVGMDDVERALAGPT
jgi:ATP-dependent Clp protease ATP-binding subunit ClpC